MAAKDLCHYLSKVIGREIKAGEEMPDSKITIHMGPDEFVLKHVPQVKDLYGDGYILKHIKVGGKDHIILSGIRWDASRWAVEEFLLQFAGVRWLYTPETEGAGWDAVVTDRYAEIVPSRPSVSVPEGLNLKYEPDYLMRSHGNFALFTKEKYWRYVRLRCQNMYLFDLGGHAFQNIFTRDDYEAHPEWFALFDIPEKWATNIASGSFAAPESVKDALTRGVRRQRWHWNYGNGWQVCTSNPETVRHAVEYARDYFAKNPDHLVVSMGHNDMNGWCECELCKEFINSADPPYTQSEQYWHWPNPVAKEIGKTHPDKMVAAIAYGMPAEPPRFPLEKISPLLLRFTASPT